MKQRSSQSPLPPTRRAGRATSTIYMCIAATLLLAPGPGCSDDGFQGGDAGVTLPDGTPPKKDGPAVHKDGPVVQKDGPVVKKDGSVVKKDGPVVKKDGPVVTPDKALPPADVGTGKLPPPPAGAVILRVRVDDSTDRTYAGGELLLKGAFKYNATTNVITPDSSWSGPPVPLWDDGAAGREGAGGVAGDHKLGTVVYLVPTASTTLEYGLISPAGWMWPDGPNAKLTVKPGDGLKDLVNRKLAPRRGIDVRFELDNKYLSGTTIQPGFEAVTVMGTFTHWAPLLCEDKGTAGDAAKGDMKYSGQLSHQIGKGKRFPHLGLLQPGQKVRFYLKVGTTTYKKTNGLVVKLISATGTSTAAVSVSGSDLTFTVPAGLSPKAAPAPETGPLPAGKAGYRPSGRFALPAGTIGGYYYVPTTYDAHRAMPLLLAIHGAYETGQWMVNVWEYLAEDLGFILVAPTKMGKNSWDLSAVWNGRSPVEEAPLLAALTKLQAMYNIDPKRIGVEGFSDGASMSLYMGLRHGKTFCVAMPNSPGMMGKQGHAYPQPDKPAVYLTHGDADTVLPVKNARAIRDALLYYKYKVVYHEFPGVGHVFPTDHKIAMIDYLHSNKKP